MYYLGYVNLITGRYGTARISGRYMCFFAVFYHYILRSVVIYAKKSISKDGVCLPYGTGYSTRVCIL